MCICIHVRTYSHLCTVVEPHIIYETCQSGLNCNVVLHTHMYTCNLKGGVEREIRMYIHTVRLKKGNANQQMLKVPFSGKSSTEGFNDFRITVNNFPIKVDFCQLRFVVNTA